MRLFNIKNTGLFMTGLLSEKETAFDQFLLYEAVIAMGNTYTIDGHINRDFYSADEIEILKQQASENGRIFSEDMIRWEAAKNFCFDFIKGKKAPLSFKVTLCLAPENINRFHKAQKRESFLIEVREYQLAFLSFGKHFSCLGIDDLGIEMVFIDMHSVLFFTLERNSRA